jgi:flagellar hook-basal body protein
MSLSGAMNVGVTGLSSNAEAITVVGNNIANVNTIGFKEGRTVFSDMLSANISAGQVGRGGQIQAVQNMFSQGSFENTSSGNDLAVQGDAMFIVQDANGSQYFTRAGAFDYNKSNILTNPDGLQVVGYGINATSGLQNGVLGAIDKTAFATLPPKITTSASFVMNLDATATTAGSSKTSSVSLTGDFGKPGGTTTSIAIGGGGLGGAAVGTIRTAAGTILPYTISAMVAGTAAPTPVTIQVGTGVATTIGNYTSTAALAGGVITFTPNVVQPVVVPLDLVPTNQNITFTDSLTGTLATGATTGVSTPAPTTPAPTSVTFYDEFGTAQAATITWGGTDPNVTYSIVINNAIAGTVGSTLSPISGTLNFPTPTTSSVTATVALNNGARPMPLTFDLSKLTDTGTATAPTATANGAPISTGTVKLTGGTTGGATTAYVSMTAAANAASLGANTVTDSLGVSHTLDFIFNASVAGVGTIDAVVDGITTAGFGAYTDAAAGNPVVITAMPATITAGSSAIAIDTSFFTTTPTTVAAPAAAPATTFTATTGTTGTFIDSAGTPHAMTVSFPTAGTWRADIVGAIPATSTVTGIFTSAANGKSTWSQSSGTVNFGGAPQTIVFDLSNVATGVTATAVSANGWNKADPALTANFANSTQVYDSEGNAHTASVYYSKTGGNTWDYHLLVPDALSINGMAGNNVLNGTLTFNSSGILVSQNPSNTDSVSIQFPSGVASQSIKLDFNPNLSTQMASSSVLSSQSQDGYASGKLMGTKIDENGYVTATYSNNQNKRIAQVALARFPALGGLEKSGNSLYINTTKSGTPLSGTATDFGIKVLSNSLEQSNVDMASQLVNMIKLQRAYSGNSKTITSADEMMQETLGLKR